MWANVQRDGRPAEYRRRPLFNAAVWLHTAGVPCNAYAAKTQTPLKFNCWGAPNSPTVLSRYLVEVHHIMRTCGEVLPFNKFFRLSIHALVAKILPDKVVRWCRDGDFLRPVFAASRVQHTSDVHAYHVWEYGIDIQSPTAKIGRGQKDRTKIIEVTWQKYNVRICYAGRP